MTSDRDKYINTGTLVPEGEQERFNEIRAAGAARQPSDRPVRVTDLVSSYASDGTEAVAGLVRSAKVAWTMFYSEAGQQTVQVSALLASGVRGETDILRFLSEAYSRAVFETAFALYFDQADCRLDCALLSLIAEGYGQSVADKVYARVADRGVVLGSGPYAERVWRVSPRVFRSERPAAPPVAAALAESTTGAVASEWPSLSGILRRFLPRRL